ncbi:MAG: DUF1599 domain-containing protein [Bacteroidota bacterium]
MIEKTVGEYKEVIEECKALFKKKTHDYGTAWRILRVPSLTDQIFIKAQRVRSIQEKGEQRVDEHVSDEFIAIINYCIMAIIQLKLRSNTKLEMSLNELLPLYENIAEDTLGLLMNKNHDYGEAWREMRVSSMTDIILMKLLRVKQIEDNQGKTLVSEGIDANYQDMINYTVFCLIKLKDE